MIYQLTNALLIPAIMKLVRTQPQAPAETISAQLARSIGRKDARIFVDEKTPGEVRGFIFATVEEFEGEEAVFIQVSIITPSTDAWDVGHGLLARVRKWAKELGLKSLYFMTTRNPRGFQKKYKFRYHATVLKRSLENEPV